jgi:lipoate-protein ligase A
MTLHLLHLKNCSILTQLQIEEALLRLDERNFCLINEGSSPAIVLGISGKVSELVDQEKLRRTPLPLIKRFSGGGTVVVDENTLFLSFICQKSLCPFPCYPEPLLRWTAELYQEAFAIADFHLRENDYAIGERKCGGNAQYLRKERFVHHTTFLWGFAAERMELLLHPKKTPAYRSGRNHEEFLCKLRDHAPSQDVLIEGVKRVLGKRYRVEEARLEELLPLLELPHRRATEVIEQQRIFD